MGCQLSLEEVLADHAMSDVFARYCQREYSEENLLFYRAVVQYRLSTEATLREEALRIFDRYIRPGSGECTVVLICTNNDDLY